MLNSAALTLEHRRPSAIAVLGLLGCLTLAVTLPLTSTLIGATVLLLGLAGRALTFRLHARTSSGNG